MTKVLPLISDNPVFSPYNAGTKLTLSQTTNFRLFQIEVFADNYFRCYENGTEFLKRVENTVGKEEIACYKQVLLFPKCFRKACFADI